MLIVLLPFACALWVTAHGLLAAREARLRQHRYNVALDNIIGGSYD